MRNKLASAGRAASLIAVVLTAACSDTTEPEPREESPSVQEADRVAVTEYGAVYLLTQMERLQSYPAALYEGPVKLDEDGCFRLVGTGSVTSVLWPVGYTVRASGTTLEIRDVDGSLEGTVGDDFHLPGGEVPFLHEGLGFTPADQELASVNCPGRFWLVSPRE